MQERFTRAERIRMFIFAIIWLAVVGVGAGILKLELGTDPAARNDAVGDDGKTEVMDAAKVDVKIAPDGAMTVEEQLTFDYDGSFRGSYRDIPLKSGEEIPELNVADEEGSLEPGGNTTLGSDDADRRFGRTTVGNVSRAVWHHRSSDEKRTFTITYRMTGVPRTRGEFVELNFQVWGDQWRAPLRDLEATILVPPGEGEVEAFVHSKYAAATVDTSGDTVRVSAEDVPKNHFVEVRVLMDASRFMPAAPFVQPGDPVTLDEVREEEARYAAELEDRRAQFEQVNERAGTWIAGGMLAGVVPMLVLILLLRRFSWREPEPSVAVGTVSEPPGELPPSVAHALTEQRMSSSEQGMVATLFDLVRKGVYRTVPAQGDGPGTQVDVALLPGSRDGLQLDPMEQSVAEIVDALLEAEPEGVALGEMDDILKDDKSLAKEVYALQQDFHSTVASYLGAANLMERGTVWPLWLVIIASPVLAFVSTGLAMDAAEEYDFTGIALWGALAIAAAGTFVVTFCALTLRRMFWKYTQHAVDRAAQWNGFRSYLERLGNMEEEQTASLPLWERYLVYGVAFGCAAGILKSVRPEVAVAAGGGAEGAAYGSGLYYMRDRDPDSIGDFASSWATVGAPASSSSGGGGGGGGSFGGGSGGGGGGSW